LAVSVVIYWGQVKSAEQGKPMSSVGEPTSSYDLDELMVQIIAGCRTMDDRL